MEESVSALTPVLTAVIGALLTWLLLRRRSVEEQGSRGKEPAPTAAAARREQMFKKAFDTAPVGMALITPQGQWLQVNGRLLKLLGYSRDEILRTSLRELTHSEDRKLEAPHARKLLSKEIASYTLDKRLMRRGRQYGLFSVSYSRFTRSDEPSEDLWLCIVEDAKHAEELERVEEASAVEALLGEMREIAVVTYDPQGIISSWNAGAERVFGVPAKEMLGRSRTVLYRESDVWEEKPRNDLRIALSNRRFDADDWRVGKDGVNLWLKVSILPDVRGDEVVRFVEICRESGQTRGVDEYRQSYERLKRASEGRIEELGASLREAQADVERKQKQTDSLREALESFRQTGEEQMAELKVLTDAFRKGRERRRGMEEGLRRWTAERDEFAQRFESAERELREREVVATNVPAEAEWSSLAHVPPADLFIALAKDKRTGTLLVSSVSVEKKVFLEDGLIFSCMSNDPALFLGQILLREGIIDAEQHRHAVELHEETGIALGRILVMSGAIDQGSLIRAMRVKVEEEIVSIFEWEDGEFTFIEGDPPSLQLVPVRLEIPPIVVRGLRRAGREAEAKAVEQRLARPEGGTPLAVDLAPHEDWGEQVEAGISEIHEEAPAPKPEATAAPPSEEDRLVEQVLAEAEQATLDLAGLNDERRDGDATRIVTSEPLLAASESSVTNGDETVAVMLAPPADAGDETVAIGNRNAALVEELDIEIEEPGDGTVAITPVAAADRGDAVVDVPEPAEESVAIEPEPRAPIGDFVASTSKKSTKYHRAGCTAVANMAEDARVWFASRADAEAAGLQACKLCRKK